MTFLHVHSLWHLIWIIPLFLLLFLLLAGKSRKTRRRLFSDEKNAESLISLSKGKRLLRTGFLLLAILCAAAAAAAPSWGRRLMPDAGPGHDLMILFDVSKSMLADDVPPSRLAQGKWLVSELLKNNPGDRFGLIAFAGDSMLLCPLTQDQTSFRYLTDGLDTDTVAFGGTNLQAALETAIKAFEGAQGNHKAVIVITDGDELSGDASGAIESLRHAGIPLFIAGIGDPEKPSVIPIRGPDGTGRFLTDSEGKTVSAPLNEVLLADLAAQSRGIYVRSTAAYSGSDEIEQAIRKLDKAESSGKKREASRPIERPEFFLAFAFLFLLAALCLSERRKTLSASSVSRLPVILFGAPLLFFPFSLHAEDAEPEVLPKKSDTVRERSAADIFNAGVKAQKENKPEEALAFYKKAIAAEKNAEIRAMAFQNIGVLSHQNARGKKAEALDALKKQDLNAAEQKLSDALAILESTEEAYCESMRCNPNADKTDVLKNQQILLHDRKSAEDLKQQIEELKKLQKQAEKQTKEALDQQQKQNQKDQKDQKDQQQQDAARSDAGKMTEEAEKTAGEMEKKARDLAQEQMEKQAKQAGEELKKARENQKKDEGKKAEKNLKDALKALDPDSGDDTKKKPDEKKDQKPDPQNQDKAEDGEKDDPSAENRPQPGQTGKKQPQPMQTDGKIDPTQANSILKEMEQNEKTFRDALKRGRMRQNRYRQPEKDW